MSAQLLMQILLLLLCIIILLLDVCTIVYLQVECERIYLLQFISIFLDHDWSLEDFCNLVSFYQLMVCCICRYSIEWLVVLLVVEHHKLEMDVTVNGDQPGWLLHQAAIYNNIDLMRSLLEGPERNSVNAQDNCGRTPLYTSVIYNSFDCCELLLDSGGNVLLSF